MSPSDRSVSAGSDRRTGAGPRPHRPRWLRAHPGFYGWGFLIALWAAVTYGGLVRPETLPSPGGMFSEFADLVQHGFNGSPLWEHIASSVGRTFSGFALAVVIGVPVGLAMGYYPAVGTSLNPIFAFLRPIPPIAFIPLAVLYFGIGNTSKVVLIFFGAFLFIVLNTQAAVKTVPQLLIRAGRNLGLSPLQLFRHVVLPGALPGIMAGIRTGFSISWALVVAAELIAAETGLGFIIEQGGTFFKLGVVYAGIVMIGIIGMLSDALIMQLQRRILHWQGR